MDADPREKEGVFVYEIHVCRSFPGDCLPEWQISSRVSQFDQFEYPWLKSRVFIEISWLLISLQLNRRRRRSADRGLERRPRQCAGGPAGPTRGTP